MRLNKANKSREQALATLEETMSDLRSLAYDPGEIYDRIEQASAALRGTF